MAKQYDFKEFPPTPTPHITCILQYVHNIYVLLIQTWVNFISFNHQNISVFIIKVY